MHFSFPHCVRRHRPRSILGLIRLAGAPACLALLYLTLPGSLNTDVRGSSYKACADSPPGMVCIPGGSILIGSGRGESRAKPRPRVDLETFYLDRRRIRNRDFLGCARARMRHCRRSSYSRRRLARRPEAIARLTWKEAHAYCRWAGKRLLMEAEWERAAGQFRLSGMLTGPHEWVHDWAGSRRRGDVRGRTRVRARGPCDGVQPCGKRRRKILKGGTRARKVDAPWPRRARLMRSGRFAARCATNDPRLYRAPGWMIRRPPPRPPAPGRPSPREVRILRDIRVDRLDKPLCPWRNSSRSYCRDQRSYIKSNEGRRRLFAPYVRNLGGGYTGVGADANYSFIAHARSRWVWLFDYDPAIVNLHRLIRVLVRASPERGDFTAFFSRGRYRDVRALVRRAHTGRTRRDILRVYRANRAVLHAHYRRISRPSRGKSTFGWLRSDENYGYIRLLFRRERIAILEGDLLKSNTMRGIARSARRLRAPIRVFYPSNAEEFWRFTSIYRANIRALPFDRRSVVIRTFSPYRVHRGIVLRWHPPRAGRYWHYVVHGARDFQAKIALPGYDSIDAWKSERLPTRIPELDIIRLPGRL